jgi:hypothetical protein
MKNLYLLALALIVIPHAFSQTQLFGGNTGNGNFENGTSDWVFVNGSQVNKWVVGGNASPGFSGTSCVYISSGSNAHQYSTTAPSYSYFYKDVAIPAGAKSGWLIFDYISNGEVVSSGFGNEAKDAFRIWARNPASAVTAGQELENVIFDPSIGYYNQSVWKKRQVRQLAVSNFAGATMRIVFQWLNDGANGNQPPAAIDNIEFYTSCQDFMAPYSDESTGTTARIIWSTIAGATGYQLRFKKVDDPNTVPSYTNPVTIVGGNTFNYTINGLTPSTNYIAEVRPVGVACAEYASPAFFATQEAPANDECAGAMLLPVWSSTQPGTVATFQGSTASTGLPASCPSAANNDVWFKFVAQSTQQYIQTNDPDYQESFYSATDINLFSGSCGSLQQVPLPCATQSNSIYQGGLVSRLHATGLTVGATYYIRVNTNNNNGYANFSISVYNPMTAPDCPVLLQPVLDSVLNYGLPYAFKWTKAIGADAYRVRIFEQSGAYTEMHVRDTVVAFTPSAGINYTWLATPYNVLDQTNGCTAATFSTCPAVANPVSISAPNGTDRCTNDWVKIVASVSGNLQWFLNNTLIPGATGDSIWAMQAGNYHVRIRNGNCYSDASNSIIINNLATPVKPSLSAGGPVSFCEGGSVTLTSSLNLNNQWFNAGAIIGSNGINYSATVSGAYYVRVTNSATGCSNYSDTINVTVNALPSKPLITAANTSFCPGDSSKLRSSATIGNQWYKDGNAIGGATDTVLYVKLAGSYTVKTTVNGCASPISDAVAIQETTIPATVTVTLTGNNTFCDGDSARLSTTLTGTHTWYLNGTPVSGVTSNIYYAKQSGNYTARVSVSGCSSPLSNAIAITVNPLPAKPTITANGYTLGTASGQTGYQWYLNNTAINGATAAQHTVLQAGNYKVEITDTKGCKNMSDNFNAVITGTNDVQLQGYRISLYPNPATEYVIVNVAPNNSIGKTFTATVTDLFGKQLLIQRLKDGINKIHLTSLAQGNYLLTLRNGNSVKTIKVMKMK